MWLSHLTSPYKLNHISSWSFSGCWFFQVMMSNLLEVSFSSPFSPSSSLLSDSWLSSSLSSSSESASSKHSKYSKYCKKKIKKKQISNCFLSQCFSWEVCFCISCGISPGWLLGTSAIEFLKPSRGVQIRIFFPSLASFSCSQLCQSGRSNSTNELD